MAKKYIDASKLKAEIKRRHDYENEMYHKTKPDGRPNDGWSESLAIMGVLEELLAFLDSLQQEQPSIPSNLDEAAMEIVIKMHPCLKDCTILGDRLTRGQLMALVKAGAEWQKEQMLKDAVEGVVCYGSKGAYIETDFLGEYDTDVYGNPGDKVRIIIVKEEK